MVTTQRTAVRAAAPAAGVAAPGRTVARMRAAGAGLPERDGLAVFHRAAALPVAEEVAGRLRAGGFANRVVMGQVGARWAGRYLDAVAACSAGHRVSRCWRPLLLARRHPSVRPAQFALAGAHASLGHDLPLALAETCRAVEAGPRDLERDFARLGDLLTALDERFGDELLSGPEGLDVTDPLAHLVGAWDLGAECESAWSAFRTLWGLRGRPDLVAEFAERLDASVGFAGRCLLTPLGR